MTDKQVKKIESASLPKIIVKWIQQKHGPRYKRRPERTRRGRILYLQKYNRRDTSSTLPKGLEDTKKKILARH